MQKRLIFFAIIGSIFLGSVGFGKELSSVGTGLAQEVESIKIDEFIESSHEKEGFTVPKDPLIAGLLSVQYPGLGQIYCRRYLRGIAYFTGEIGCFILASVVAGVETKTYSYTVKDEKGEELKLTHDETISNWDDLSGLEKTGVVGLILGGIGLHAWNVIDAYHLAQEHNQRLGWIRNVDVQLGFKDKAPSLKVAVSKKF